MEIEQNSELERLIEGDKQGEDVSLEVSLRPKSFDEFPGQQKVKKKLLVPVLDQWVDCL